MCHDHAFSLTTDQLSWQLSLDLGLSLALGLSTELNCVIWVQPLSQIPSTDLHCKFFDPEGGLKHKFRQQVCCIHAGCLDAALVCSFSCSRLDQKKSSVFERHTIHAAEQDYCHRESKCTDEETA